MASPPQVHRLDIAEPIWHNRTVGLNLMNFSSDAVVEVVIGARNKHGFRHYPDPLYIRVSEAVSIGTTQDRAGASITIVPIKSLYQSIEQATHQPSTMSTVLNVFNKGDIDAINEEAGKSNDYESKELFDPAEVNRLAVYAIETTTWDVKGKDENGNETVVGKVTGVRFKINHEKPDQRETYRDVEKFFNMESTTEDYPMDKLQEQARYLSKFLQSSYGVSGLPSVKSLKELVENLKKYINTPFLAAIRHYEEIWSKSDGTMYVVTEQRIYYTGTINETDFRPTEPSKRVVKLNEADQAKFNAYMQSQGGGEVGASSSGGNAAGGPSRPALAGDL